MTEVLAHAALLQGGTQLSFTTQLDYPLVVEVVESEGSHSSPFVEVRVTRPARLFDIPAHTTHMLFVTAGKIIDTLEAAYVAANYVLKVGDQIVLAYGQRHVGFTITAVEIKEPALV